MKKWLICVMSLLLLLGLGTPASADSINADWENDDWGDCGPGKECRLAGYDIARAKVEVYPAAAGVPEYLNMCVEMAPESSLPGVIALELDVDNDLATGGTSGMLGIPCGAVAACHEPTGCPNMKVQPGIDILILAFLRDQADTASSAWCDNCIGPPGQGRCFLKDELCEVPTCSTTGDCYKADCSCNPGQKKCSADSGGNRPCRNCTTGADCDGGSCLACWVASDPCQPVSPPCQSCYEMTELCNDCMDSCGMGRAAGEWYVTAVASSAAGGGKPPDRGRIEMPLPRTTNSDDSDCYKLPYARIVQAVYDELDGHPKQFDLAKAQDPETFLKWQLSTWYDDTGTTPPFDFFGATDCVNFTDVIPNDGADPVMASAQLTNGGTCHMFQGHFQGCMEIMADDGNYKDVSADFYDCQAFHGNQGACEGEPLCSWADPKCLACIPFSDSTFDGFVNAWDFGVLKYGWDRPQFPCAPQ